MMTNETQTIDADALRARLAETPAADVIDHLDALLARQHAILTGVADALRGDPGPLASHSHHDLAERAAAVVRERDDLRDAAREYLAARHKALVATLAYLDADPADAAARDAASASEARVTAARTRLTTLVGDTTPRRDLPAEREARLEVARGALRALVGGAR